MIYPIFFALSIFFIEVFIFTKVFSHLYLLCNFLKNEGPILFQTNATDEEKEEFAKRAAAFVLMQTVLFFLKFLIPIIIIFIPYQVLVNFEIFSYEQVSNLALAWELVIAVSVFSIFYLKIRKHVTNR